MSDIEKIKKVIPLDEAQYKNIDLDHLIIYAVSRLERLHVGLSFENIVVASFRLFPKKFSLLGYSEYPDANRVYKRLWDCISKSKQWLGGHFRKGFVITERSKIFIKEAEEKLQDVSLQNKQVSSRTRRQKEVLINELIASPAYSKYLNNQGETITEAEFCFLLQGTLDSSVGTLRNNLNLFKNLVSELGRQDLLEFFKFLESRFKKLSTNDLK